MRTGAKGRVVCPKSHCGTGPRRRLRAVGCVGVRAGTGMGAGGGAGAGADVAGIPASFSFRALVSTGESSL